MPRRGWQRLLFGVLAVFLCAARPAPDGYELMLGGGTGGFSFREGGCSEPVYRYEVEQRVLNGQLRVNDNGWLHEVEANVARQRVANIKLEGMGTNASSTTKRSPKPPRLQIGDIDYSGNLSYRFGHAWSHASICGGLALLVPRKNTSGDRTTQPFFSLSTAIYAGDLGPYLVADLLSGPTVLNEIPVSAGVGYRWSKVQASLRAEAGTEGGVSLRVGYDSGSQIGAIGALYASGDTGPWFGTVGLVWRPEAGRPPPAKPEKSYDGWHPDDD